MLELFELFGLCLPMRMAEKGLSLYFLRGETEVQSHCRDHPGTIRTLMAMMDAGMVGRRRRERSGG